MKYRLLFFGCVIHTIVTFSQGVENVGARSISLGEATVALKDVYAYFSNPAGTSANSSCVVAINYQNKFLINEFQQSSMILAVPLNKGVVSIGGMISGQSLFRSSRIGTGYTLKLSDIFSFGAQVNFQQIQIQNVTSSNDLQAALGFLLNVSSRLKVGVAVFNLGAGLFDKRKTEIAPLLIRMGGNFSPNSRLNILTEIEKDILHSHRLKCGVEYLPVENLSLRSGVVLNEQLVTFGVGYRSNKKLVVDLGGGWQQRLGWCPSIGIHYVFNNEDK